MVGFLVVTVICITFYKFVELIVRKKERNSILEKIDFNRNMDGQPPIKLPSLGTDFGNFGKFTAFRIGMALLGLGFGILVAFFIVAAYAQETTRAGDVTMGYYEARAVAYPACAMLFGGIALILSYIIEQVVRRNSKKLDE